MKKETLKRLQIEQRVLAELLAELPATHQDYETTLDRIRDIEAVLELEEQRKGARWWNIDPNVIIQCGVSVATALMVLNYEKTDVIVSKAWNLIGGSRRR